MGLTYQGNQEPVYLCFIYIHYMRERFPITQYGGESVGSWVFSNLSKPLILSINEILLKTPQFVH